MEIYERWLIKRKAIINTDIQKLLKQKRNRDPFNIKNWHSSWVAYWKQQKKKNTNVTCTRNGHRHTVTYEGWNFNSGNYLFTIDTK